MSNQIDNSQNTIDSRDVIKRIEELEGEVTTLDVAARFVKAFVYASEDADAKIEGAEALTEADVDTLEENIYYAGGDIWRVSEKQNDYGTCEITGEETETITIESLLDEDDADELRSLKALEEECVMNEVDDWRYGATLIRESYFTDYARELADDIGAISKADDKWPTNCIDWEKAASELKQDYSEVYFDGVTYYVR